MPASAEYGVWQGIVEYSHNAMEQIRVAAVNGFNSFGHGGLEIGGVLYGERRGDVVRILAAVELSCEHALGPGFALSEKDQAGFRELMKAPAGMRTVGWYCSHTRSGVALNANDCAIMERFFGERGNVALIVKPTRFGPVEATFHIQGCAEAGPHFSVLVARLEPRGQSEDSAPSRSRLHEGVPRLNEGASRPHEEVSPPNEPAPVLKENPASAVRARPHVVRWAAMGVLLAALGAWYISTRPAQQAAPPVGKIGLQVYNIADRQVRIEWDRQSGAIRSAAAGTLEIEDGASKYSLPLSAEQLRSSSMTYGRQTEAMSVRLRLASGLEESVHVVIPVAPPPPMPAVVEAASLPEPKRTETPRAEPPQADRRSPLRRFELTANRPPEVRDVALPDAPPPTSAPALGLIPKLAAPVVAMPAAPVAAPASNQPARAPRSGRLIWTGSLGRRGVVEFEGSTATVGLLSGVLPGVAAKVSALPAEFARDGLVVYVTDAARHNRTEAPSASNGWNRLHFVWDPERLKQISVLESPNPNNQYARLALRNEARSCSVIVVEWSTQ